MIETIAKVCHEANKAFCEANGDFSQKPWEEAEEWQRHSTVHSIEFLLANPAAKASALHDAWLKDKAADGWVYGEVKDAEKKTHPCIVPFEQLPKFQQQKDVLFQAIVDALKE